MKKSITCAVLCAAMLSLLSLSGCGHEHTVGEWKTGVDTHWQECKECSEKINEAAHSFDEFEICTECSSAVYKEEDGAVSIYTYDENGSLIYNAGYNPEGELTYYFRYEIVYYSDGNTRSTKEYAYDILSEFRKEFLSNEMSFAPCEDPENGEVFVNSETYYNEDGSGMSYENDEVLGVVKSVAFDDKGVVYEENVYEYELDENGEIVKECVRRNGTLYSEIYYSDDDEGGRYAEKYLYYDQDGNISEEYHYDAFGEQIEAE